MSRKASIELGEIMASTLGSVDPSRYPDEVFDLYSIPAFDSGAPEVLPGKNIGSAKQIVEPGDVLLSKIVPHIRRSWVVGGNRGRRIIASGEWIVFRGENLGPGYLRHVLVGDPFHAEFMSTVSGVGGSLLRARPAHVAKIRIPLPPLPEQRRIAEVLDQADALRAKRRAALSQAGTLTQSIFLEMFGDPVTNRRGFPVSEMGDVCDVRDGTHDSPKYVSDGGYPLVTSRNLSGGVVDLTGTNYISEADYVQINRRSKVDRGDIIMPMIGTIGSPVIVDHEPHYGIKNVALIKFTEASPSAVFVHHLLSCHYFDYILSHKNRGGTQKFISLGDLRAFPLPLPPKALQREFIRRVQSIERLRAAHRASLALLDALFASLQHQAFRGEL